MIVMVIKHLKLYLSQLAPNFTILWQFLEMVGNHCFMMTVMLGNFQLFIVSQTLWASFIYNSLVN